MYSVRITPFGLSITTETSDFEHVDNLFAIVYESEQGTQSSKTHSPVDERLKIKCLCKICACIKVTSTPV